MKATRLSLIVLIAAALLVSSPVTAQTIAVLNGRATPDIPPASRTSGSTTIDSSYRRPVHLSSTSLSRAAANAFFVDSDPGRAGLLAAQALRRDPQDAEALFVRMEVAAMEADEAAKLDAAVRLCEAGPDAAGDVRVQLAAARIRESAANTPEFRKAIPRLQSLLANTRYSWRDLHAALLDAAMDGAPGLDPYAASRAAGILTDWRIVGPLGRHVPLDFDEQTISPSEELTQASYQNRWVENFQFPDGRIVLPGYMSHRGSFYAASRFASLTAAHWTAEVDGGGAVEVYVDGRSVLAAQSGPGAHSAVFEATPGPHRILVKFAGSARPIRVSLFAAQEVRSQPPTNISLAELTYQLAAEHYAAGEFGSAIRQITAVGVSRDSAALQFLLAQSLSRHDPTSSDCATAWYKLQKMVPNALSADNAMAQIALSQGDRPNAARLASRVLAVRHLNRSALETITSAEAAGAVIPVDEESLWSQRLTGHSSCRALHDAVAFYRAHGRMAQARSAQQKLNGCAPESLDYARSLAGNGNHVEAVRSLQQLVAAAPLNRAARLMLVRELQLSGEDEAAQKAAAEWLRVAPNAENYHRLAAASSEANSDLSEASAALARDFYSPYRRDAAGIARALAQDNPDGDAAVLLDDHVAIARPDGSVSLYVHIALRVSGQSAPSVNELALPEQAHLVSMRVLHAGTAAFVGPEQALPALAAGDVIDEEYVMHYAGDGGIPEHAEAFQFVFGSFNEQVLHARFVVLTPADRADRGVVIASGEAPNMTSQVSAGMLERVWNQDEAPRAAATQAESAGGSAIVRVVEQEHGWTVPSNAEHHRRIETIHPGPRPEDS